MLPLAHLQKTSTGADGLELDQLQLEGECGDSAGNLLSIPL